MANDNEQKHEKPENPGKPDDPGNSEHRVEILVNEKPVVMVGKTVTGHDIKVAAIAQGVAIELNFVLQEELPNGTSKIIRDTDPVHLRPHLKFTAIAPDDNS